MASDDNVALMENPLSDVDPREPKASEEAAKLRNAAQERREATRRCLERMSLFFKRPDPRYFWTKPQVLFYGKPIALILRSVSYLPRFS